MKRNCFKKLKQLVCDDCESWKGFYKHTDKYGIITYSCKDCGWKTPGSLYGDGKSFHEVFHKNKFTLRADRQKSR